ncbi:hypothetical protein [Amycolatopsis anabasis]|uniref:hypothetical protein n=1 Tax=Amycolatopsis anabasis TaxID=1840409 RepID=UPI00131E7161|nr:hypothetical protein [Amycolatopsis anabasis]
MTPPPNRGDKPRHPEYLEYLRDPKVNLIDNPRLKTAPELGSWIEWLLHPEEHIGARSIIEESGARHEMDQNLPTQKTETTPPPPNEHDPTTMPGRDGRLPGWNVAHYYPYESVLERWEFAQFFGFQSAVSTQRVERSDSLFAGAAAALAVAKWSTDDHNHQIAAVPTEGWESGNGDTFRRLAAEAADILAKIAEIINVSLVVALAEYTMTIKKTREALDESTRNVVRTFDSKLPKEAEGSAVLAFVITFVLGELKEKVFDKIKPWLGGPAKIATLAVDHLWETVVGLVQPKRKENPDDVKDRSGWDWDDIAKSYLRGQADILDLATRRIDELTRRMAAARAELAAVPLRPKEG